MGIEGQLRIALKTNAGCVNQVKIESTRPVHAARVFQGKTVLETQKMMPMLFSICGTAQAVASALACEQASGDLAESRLQAARECLVRMEIIREHLWRILLDWPAFLNEAPEQSGMSDILSLQKEHRLFIAGKNDLFHNTKSFFFTPELDTLKPLADKASVILEQTVFGIAPSVWLNIKTQTQLESWAASGQTIAARLLNHILQSEYADIGRNETPPLPDMNPNQLQFLMRNDDFIERPQWNNTCHETSCLTRVNSALLRQFHKKLGNGLLTRLIARLTDIAQLSMRLLPDTDQASPDAIEKTVNPAQITGIGQTTAARGQLIHRVQLEGKQITRYQIVAPTEWNFHPQGVVAKSLSTLCGDNAKIKHQAELLINAIDPCVAFKLSIN